MAADAVCPKCGRQDVILPALASGRLCQDCGAELVATGVPQRVNSRWDRTRFLSPDDREAVEFHQRKMAERKVKDKKLFMDGVLEEVPLETMR